VVQQAEELRTANELKSRFLANISHEFRTPLTLTFGPIDDLLSGRYHVEEAARPHLERARRNGHRLLRLINQLLDLSKLDAGALLLRPRRHDLAQHLRQLAALFDSIAETQKVHYSTRIPQEPLWHRYDTDKIEKVVINLLSNAFKFTPPGRKVAVSLIFEADGTACIVVADTGPGIAEEHLSHRFDRFYQVEGSSTRRHEGSGIGLALVKELVALHDGTITVESTVGFGTRFTVRLPRLAVEEAVSSPEQEMPVVVSPAEAAYDPTISGSLRVAPLPEPEEAAVPEDATVVLVVEDNADMRSYIRSHLHDVFTIVEAENGKVGLERALEVVPDLVLSDVMMPEMDGLELCAALKEDARTSHIPVVLLTAKVEVEHRIEGFESGADAYLPKPFNAEELIVRVRTLVEGRRQLQARFAGTANGAPASEGQDTASDEAAVERVLPPREVAFLEKVQALVAKEMRDTQFGVDHMAEAFYMSRRQFHRKLRALLDETPAALLRRMRLERAAELLEEGALSVKQILYEIGFKDPSSFARLFRETYGVSPSEYGGHQ
ncbi:MAG: response regulator, partial [Bacteroidetes bacterium]|nr:response regulator [Bacteroidota bacterium]